MVRPVAVVELTVDVQTLYRIDTEGELLVGLILVGGIAAAVLKRIDVGEQGGVAVGIVSGDVGPVAHDILPCRRSESRGGVVLTAHPAVAVAECQPWGEMHVDLGVYGVHQGTE